MKNNSTVVIQFDPKLEMLVGGRLPWPYACRNTSAMYALLCLECVSLCAVHKQTLASDVSLDGMGRVHLNLTTSSL